MQIKCVFNSSSYTKRYWVAAQKGLDSSCPTNLSLGLFWTCSMSLLRQNRKVSRNYLKDILVMLVLLKCQSSYTTCLPISSCFLGFNSSQQHSSIYYSEDHVLNRTKYSAQGLRTNDQHFRCEFNLPKINIDIVDTKIML